MDESERPRRSDAVVRPLSAGLVIGLTGGFLALYIPLWIYPFGDFNLVYAVTGMAGGMRGRSWAGLAAVVGGAAAGSAIGLVAWAVLDLPGAQFIPLAAVILLITLPPLVGGAYLIVRAVARLVGRLRS